MRTDTCFVWKIKVLSARRGAFAWRQGKAGRVSDRCRRASRRCGRTSEAGRRHLTVQEISVLINSITLRCMFCLVALRNVGGVWCIAARAASSSRCLAANNICAGKVLMQEWADDHSMPALLQPSRPCSFMSRINNCIPCSKSRGT